MAAAAAFWVANTAATWIGLAEGSAWTTAIYWAAYAGASYGLATGAAKLAAKDLNEAGKFQAREFLVKSGKSPETVVYGQAWVGGVLAYANQKHATNTKDNFEVYMVVAHAAHEVEDIIDLYYDNDFVSHSWINWGAQRIEAGKYFVLNDGVYAVQVSKHLGTSTQTAPSLLTGAAAPISTDWTSAHQARGRALTCHVFTYFSTTSNTPDALFGGGVPTNIRAFVKGKKIYDPRLDSTNGGSGSHRFATPSTWAWSDNPILCYTDYRTHYMGVAFDRMDWTWIRAQADICDALVIVPPSSSPTIRQKRYTCNGVIALTNTHKENCDAILSSCIGTCPKVSGKWRPTAGAYVAPDVTLNEDDIVGEIKMIGSVQREDRYNTVNAVYYNPVDFAQEIDALPVTDSGFVSRDNGATLNKSISLPFTNNEYMAQRIAYKWLLQSDRQISCVVPLRWTGLKIAIGTRVQLSVAKLGWVDKIFRCTNWVLGGESPIAVVLREDDSAAWADPAIGEYSTRSAQGVVEMGAVSLPTYTSGTGQSGEATVRNGNFELGDWYWDPDGTGWAIEINANAHQGSWVCRRTYAGGASTSALRNTHLFPIAAGNRVTFGGYFKTTGGWAAGSGGVRAAFYDSSGTEFADVDATTSVANTTYALLLNHAIAPAGSNWVQMQGVSYGQTAGTMYLDDLFMSVQTGAGTATLDDNAATEIYTVSDSGVDSYTGLTQPSTPDYYMHIDVPTALNDDTQILVVTLSTEMKDTSGNGPGAYILVQQEDLSIQTSTVFAVYETNLWRRGTVQFSLDGTQVPHGDDLHICAVIQTFVSGGATFDVANTTMVVEVIKR